MKSSTFGLGLKFSYNFHPYHFDNQPFSSTPHAQVAGIVMTHLFINQIKEQIELWNKPPTYKYRPSQDVNGRSGPFL